MVDALPMLGTTGGIVAVLVIATSLFGRIASPLFENITLRDLRVLRDEDKQIIVDSEKETPPFFQSSSPFAAVPLSIEILTCLNASFRTIPLDPSPFNSG